MLITRAEDPNSPLLRVIENCPGPITAVAALGENRAVTGGQDGALWVWDLKHGTRVSAILAHDGRINSVSVLTDGRRAVSGSEDMSLKVWDLETGECLCTLEGHTGSIGQVSVLPDGRRVVSGSRDNTLNVWDLETGVCLCTLEGHTGSVESVSVLPDGRRAVSGSSDKTLKVWDLETGECLRTLKGHTGSVWSVSVLIDGRRAVSGSGDRALKVWELETGECLRTLKGHTGSVWSVSVLSYGLQAVSGSRDDTLKVWDLATGECLRTLEGHTNSVESVSVLSDRRRAVSGSRDNTLKVWDLEMGKCLRTLEGHTDSVGSVSVLPDGRRAVSGSGDRSLKVWDLKTGACLRMLEGHRNSVLSVSVLSDGRRAVSGSRDKTLKMWDLETGECLRTLEGHTNWVGSVAVMSDGRRAVSGSGDNTLKVWDLETGECLRTLEGHTNWIESVSVLSGGRRAVSGSSDNTLKVWDLETGECLRTLKGHTYSVWSVSLLPDGRRAVSGSWDNTLKVWDLETGEWLCTLEGHTNSVEVVSVLSDGRRAVSGSYDKTLKVWDLETGECLRTLEHPGVANALVLGNDGVLVSVGHYGLILQWDLDSILAGATAAPSASTFASAKVVLVGDSSIGKTSLARQLIDGTFNPDEETTHGMRIWNVPAEDLGFPEAPHERREVVLWDFGGQEYYRLIHQLFLHDTTLAMMLFDPTRGAKALDEVSNWEGDLAKQLREKKAAKLLIGAKLDNPAVLTDRTSIEEYAEKNGFSDFICTSAKERHGLEDLKSALRELLDWDKLSKGTRPEHFQVVRDEIEKRRQRGDVVARLSELCAVARAWIDAHPEGILESEKGRAADAVVDQLSMQGALAVTRMPSGENIAVLQVGLVEEYAGSLLLLVKDNPRKVPALQERDLADLARLELPRMKVRVEPYATELALIGCVTELMIERGLCIRTGGLLVFPCLLNCEAGAEPLVHARPIYYEFSGPVMNIYAGLVCHLGLSDAFGSLRILPGRAELVRRDGILGIRQVTTKSGLGHLDVYYEGVPEAAWDEFIAYVEDYLTREGVTVQEVQAIGCPCGGVIRTETVKDAVEAGRQTVYCPLCREENPILRSAATSKKADAGLANRLQAIRIQVEEEMKRAGKKASFDIQSTGELRRLDLIKQLRMLASADLDSIILAVGAEHHVRAKDNQVARVNDLIEWADRPGGISLRTIVQTAQELEILLPAMSVDHSGAMVLSEPESEEEAGSASLPPIRVLHLSDLHFTASTDPRAAVEPLWQDLRTLEAQQLDALVISGDFKDKGDLEGFDRAGDFIEELMRRTKLNAQQVVIVPGNHDVEQLERAYEYKTNTKGIPEDRLYRSAAGDVTLVRNEEEYQKRFLSFSRRLYHRISKAEAYPLDSKEQGMAFIFVRERIQFLALNTSWQIDQFYPKRSGVLEGAVARCLEKADRQIEQARELKQIGSKEKILRLGVWHHAVAGPELMPDLAFLGQLRKAGVRICLHGDVHELRRELMWNWRPGEELHVIGAGAFGAPAAARPPAMPMLYNLMEISRDLKSCIVRTRCRTREGGEWEGYSKWPTDEKGVYRDWYTIELEKAGVAAGALAGV